MSGKRVVGWRVRDAKDGVLPYADFSEMSGRGFAWFSRPQPPIPRKRDAERLRRMVREQMRRDLVLRKYVTWVRLVRVVKGGAR